MHFKALASDYDGTIAHHGNVDRYTLDALRRFKSAGGVLILVTGREVPDLQRVFPELALFEYVVAENGALLFEPSSGVESALAEPAPSAFIEKLRERGVGHLSVGRVIVASHEPYESRIIEVIREMGLELQILFNKGSVMVLPSGVNKASGLKKLLEKIQISPELVVGVGDAENDHSLFQLCGFSAAVNNALPAVKKAANLALTRSHGAGVAELIDLILQGRIEQQLQLMQMTSHAASKS